MQKAGYFHAGGTSAIADSAGGYAGFTLFPEGSSVLTVEFKLNLISPAQGDYLEAVGRVIKNGRTLTICQLDVWGVDGKRRKHVATGTGGVCKGRGRSSAVEAGGVGSGGTDSS